MIGNVSFLVGTGSNGEERELGSDRIFNLDTLLSKCDAMTWGDPKNERTVELTLFVVGWTQHHQPFSRYSMRL